MSEGPSIAEISIDLCARAFREGRLPRAWGIGPDFMARMFPDLEDRTHIEGVLKGWSTADGSSFPDLPFRTMPAPGLALITIEPPIIKCT